MVDITRDPALLEVVFIYQFDADEASIKTRIFYHMEHLRGSSNKTRSVTRNSAKPCVLLHNFLL